MTAGETLIQQGLESLLEQEFEQGIHRGERRMLLRVVQHRFGDKVSAATEQRIAAASDQQLSTWVRRFWSAASLEELLAE